MSFVMFILLTLSGYVFLHTKNFLVQVLGVALIVTAFNPLSEALTGNSIPKNIGIMWNAGEKMYNSLNKG